MSGSVSRMSGSVMWQQDAMEAAQSCAEPFMSHPQNVLLELACQPSTAMFTHRAYQLKVQSTAGCAGAAFFCAVALQQLYIHCVARAVIVLLALSL